MTASSQVVPCPPERRLAALELLLSRELDLAGRADWIRRLLARGADSPSWEGLWILEAQGRLLGAAWLEGLQRRVGTLWPPRLSRAASPADGAALVAQVRRQAQAAGQHSIILQLSDASADCALWLSGCGFEILGDLLDLECDLVARGPARPFPRPASLPAGAEWLDRSDLPLPLVGEVIDRTYRDSQDFPELRQPRTGAELASDFLSKPCGAGGFCRILGLPTDDPSAAAAAQDAAPYGRLLLVGAALVGREPDASNAEINYLGLVPSARGRKWGKWMTSEARGWARGTGAESMWVSVDSRNAAATSAYRANGFRERSQRLVMYSLVGGSAPTPASAYSGGSKPRPSAAPAG